MSPTRCPSPTPRPAPPPRSPAALRLGRAALVASGALAAWSLGGCRGVLGIDDLAPRDEGDAGGEQGGAGGAAGGGGRAGTGGGSAGRSGTGGGGGGPVDAKVCQNACAESAGKKGLEAYYNAAQNCACDAADPANCRAACAGDCALKLDEFAAKPKECIACVARQTLAAACQPDLSGCDKECAAFRDCVEACPK